MSTMPGMVDGTGAHIIRYGRRPVKSPALVCWPTWLVVYSEVGAALLGCQTFQLPSGPVTDTGPTTS